MLFRSLGTNEIFLVVISSKLDSLQEGKLLNVLRKYKNAIGWNIADIEGISPLVCTHKIYLEDNTKPSREMHRRLNPTMKKLVRTKVLKLLDVGIIYPITNSKWVSPTHVVPKKSGISVVKNENNQLIPTHVTTSWHVCTNYRKLNAITKLKLLDVGIIYPIANSKWVSPTQVVPKKSGITVVKNENNQLIPTHVTTSWHMCTDYRKLNAITKKDHFLLPFLD